MTKICLHISSVFCLIIIGLLLTLPAIAEEYGAIEKKKSVIKIYDVSGKDNLLIDNQFGQVKINLWEKSEIRIDVKITANANDDNRAQQYLNGVEIEDKREGDQIRFRTIINKNGNPDWNRRNNNGEKNFVHIDYTVSMPKNTPLIVKNRFGTTNIPFFMAPLIVQSMHGNFIATDLSGSKNDIDVSYGKAEIQQLLNGNLDIAYSGGRIGTLKGSSKIKFSYSGGFKIDALNESAENVDIQASYSSLTIPMENNNCNFDVTVSYGGFNYPSDRNVSFTQNDDERKDNSHRYIPRMTKQYIGKIGKGNGTKVKIVSKYGQVSLR